MIPRGEPLKRLAFSHSKIPANEDIHRSQDHECNFMSGARNGGGGGSPQGSSYFVIDIL